MPKTIPPTRVEGPPAENAPGLFRAAVDKGYETQTENLGLVIYIVVMLVTIVGVVLFYRKTQNLPS